MARSIGSPRRPSAYGHVDASGPVPIQHGECEMDHHLRADNRFHPHLSSSLMRVEIGPKYKEPTVLIGPNSPTRSNSRPTSPMRLERAKMQQIQQNIAQLQQTDEHQQAHASHGRVSASGPFSLPSDLYESPMRSAPTPTPRESGAVSVAATPATHSATQAEQSAHLAALSHQLEFDMHLLSELKGERHTVASKFASLMSQLGSDGVLDPQTEPLRQQFTEQLHKYDGRIEQLQIAISEAAKQMAIGCQQQQTSAQQQQHHQGRITFSPEQSSASHPSRTAPAVSPSSPSDDLASFVLESLQFEQVLPAHLHNMFNALKQRYTERIRKRDIQVVEAHTSQLMADLKTSQAVIDSQASEIDTLHRELERLQTDLTRTQQELSTSEERRQEVNRLYQHAADEREARRAAEREVAAAIDQFSPDSEQSRPVQETQSVVQSLLSKLNVERSKYEEVYSTLLRAKQGLEESHAADVLQVQSLRAQLSHEKEQGQHAKKLLTQAFQNELKEKSDKLDTVEKRCKELEQQLNETRQLLDTDREQSNTTRTQLTSELATLTRQMKQAQQEAIESALKVKELTVERDAFETRLEAAHSRGTQDHLDLLALRGEQLKWEADRDALQLRLVDELRHTDGLTRLLDAEMATVARCRDDLAAERDARLEGEKGREALAQGIRDKEAQLRTEIERSSKAAIHTSDVEAAARAQVIRIEDSLRELQRELAQSKSDQDESHHATTLAKDSLQRVESQLERASSQLSSTKLSLRASELALSNLREEHEALLEVRRDLEIQVTDFTLEQRNSKEQQQQLLHTIEQCKKDVSEAHAMAKQARTEQLEANRRTSTLEKELEQIQEAHADELRAAHSAQAILEEKLDRAHHLQSSMAQAASQFSDLLHQRATVYPHRSPVREARNATSSHIPTSAIGSGVASAPPPTSAASIGAVGVSVDRAGSPIRTPRDMARMARELSTGINATPNFSNTQPIATSTPAAAAAPIIHAATPGPDNTPPAVRMETPARAPPTMIAGDTVDTPSLSSSSSSSFRPVSSFSPLPSGSLSDTALLRQLTSLKQLRASLALDPLLATATVGTSHTRILSPNRKAQSLQHLASNRTENQSIEQSEYALTRTTTTTQPIQTINGMPIIKMHSEVTLSTRTN